MSAEHCLLNSVFCLWTFETLQAGIRGHAVYLLLLMLQRSRQVTSNFVGFGTCLLTYAHRSLWSIGHQRSPPCTLFLAAQVILDQLVPCCFNSASVSRLQLLQDRPLFFFPCGFQVRAWRVVLDAGFLGVCPIQPHYLSSICLATGSGLVTSRQLFPLAAEPISESYFNQPICHPQTNQPAN